MKKTFVIMLVAVLGVCTVIHSNRKAVFDVDLFNVEALADDETIDGGGLPGIGITCSSGNSGKCFEVRFREGLYDKCWFYCSFTGSRSDYCSAWYVGLVNVCTIAGGIYSLDKDV